MHKSIDANATEILQAAKINAEADGHAFQSEEYFHALVDELLRRLDDANEPTRVRPLLYAPLDDALDGSSSLVLVDIDCIDYVCHALADETNEARFALVPPAAEKVKSYSKLPIVDLDEYEERFNIRGRVTVPRRSGQPSSKSFRLLPGYSVAASENTRTDSLALSRTKGT